MWDPKVAVIGNRVEKYLMLTCSSAATKFSKNVENSTIAHNNDQFQHFNKSEVILTQMITVCSVIHSTIAISLILLVFVEGL